MKLIIAAIKPFKLEEVREALTAIGVRGSPVPSPAGWGVEIDPAWLEKARYQMSEI